MKNWHNNLVKQIIIDFSVPSCARILRKYWMRPPNGKVSFDRKKFDDTNLKRAKQFNVISNDTDVNKFGMSKREVVFLFYNTCWNSFQQQFTLSIERTANLFVETENESVLIQDKSKPSIVQVKTGSQVCWMEKREKECMWWWRGIKTKGKCPVEAVAKRKESRDVTRIAVLFPFRLQKQIRIILTSVDQMISSPFPSVDARNRPSGENDCDPTECECFWGRIRFLFASSSSSGFQMTTDLSSNPLKGKLFEFNSATFLLKNKTKERRFLHLLFSVRRHNLLLPPLPRSTVDLRREISLCRWPSTTQLLTSNSTQTSIITKRLWSFPSLFSRRQFLRCCPFLRSDAKPNCNNRNAPAKSGRAGRCLSTKSAQAKWNKWTKDGELRWNFFAT